MDVILKNVKEKHMKVIKALAEELGIEIDRPDKPFDGTFVGQKHTNIAGEIENTPDIKMTINDIDKLWE